MKTLLRKILNGIRFLTKLYDHCPNCGDNWWWKESGWLYYTESSTFHVCKECLANPQSLDEEKIVRELRLMKPRWYDEEKLEKMRQAVLAYKKLRKS